MKLFQLKYFVDLAKTEQMKQTAKNLFVSQPSLSQGIHNLEEELGVQLFDRVGRRIKLNRYGKSFYQRINKALSDIDMAKNEVQSMANLTTGKIDIGFIYSLGVRFIPSLIANYTQNNRISFQSSQKNTESLLHELQEGTHDVVFCTEDIRWNHLKYFPICHQDICFIVGNNHPILRNKNITLKDIQKTGLITFDSKSGVRPRIEKFFAERDMTPNINFEVVDDLTLIGLVSENLGVGMLPESNILNKFPVKKINISDPLFSQTVYMVQNPTTYKSELVNTFTKYVRDNTSKLNKFI